MTPFEKRQFNHVLKELEPGSKAQDKAVNKNNMAAKFEQEMSNGSNIEVSCLCEDGEEIDISRGLEAIPVRLQSTIRIMKYFQYVAHMICGPGVDIDFDHSMYPGCECVGECDETSCVCIARYGPNYDRQRRLLKTENTAGYCLPNFECNSNCQCPTTCDNRLSQQGITVRLEVFQTSNRGLGVRTLDPIPKHNFITEYSGEIISLEEAKRRTGIVSKRNTSDSNYLMVLKEHISGGSVLRTHIDAANFGNVARFMNHSCEPNMVMFPVRHNSPVPRLCLFAARNIDVGEELTFSYGDILDKGLENCQVGKTSQPSFKSPRTKCLCGCNSCTGYLPFEERLY